MTNDLDRNKSLVRAHFEALETGNYASLDRLHDSAGRNHAPGPFDLSEWPAEGRPFGPAEVRATFEWLRAGAADLHVEVEDLIAEGDQVDAWVRITGTQTGAGGPVLATGQSTDFRQAEVGRMSIAFESAMEGSLSTGRSEMTFGR